MENSTLVAISGLALILILGILKLIKENNKTKELSLKNIFERENPKPIINKKNNMENGFMKEIRRANAISISKFNEILNEWVSKINCEDTVGDETFGQKAYIHVKVENKIYHLNADSKRKAVMEYLNEYKDAKWVVVKNRKGTINKVAFGLDEKKIKGLYLYLYLN
jgi:hypothetical protein